MRRHRVIVLAAAVLASGIVTVPALARKVPCPGPTGVGGEWRSYGHDLSNTRSQPAETTIGATNAAQLDEAFRIDSTDMDGGLFQNTPVVADGCLFGANTAGWVFAADANTGAIAWRHKLEIEPGQVQAGDGVIVGSVAVHDGLVYAVVNQKGSPWLAALDQQTGAEQWRAHAGLEASDLSYGSPIVYDADGKKKGAPLVAFGVIGNPALTKYRGAVAVIDTGTREVHQVPVIPDADYCQDPKCHVGYAGGSVWSTGAVDTVGGYAYYGTGNPAASGPQHPNTNSIIKIDLDRSRPTFTQIVDVYHGNPDNLVSRDLDEHPVCRQVAPELFYPASSPLCVHMDLDFGASPNLFRASDGRQLVGALQKSGRFHAADTTTMDKAWETVVGTPCFPCNAASSAFDGDRIITVAAPPGQVFGLARDTGSPQWVAPVLDGLHYDAISTANGVSYTFDGETLHIYDNVTGTEVASHRISGAPVVPDDALVPEELSDRAVAGFLQVASGGVAIANGTVYAAANDTIVALRLGDWTP